MVYKMGSRESPNAKAMLTNPMGRPASTTLLTPPITSTKVYTSSAKYLFIDVSSISSAESILGMCRRLVAIEPRRKAPFLGVETAQMIFDKGWISLGGLLVTVILRPHRHRSKPVSKIP
jgi:hypothetical protein